MKKLLALVLALVMTLSLCTISNAAYSDAADVDFDEAVEVMSAVGVFQGADGKFSPKANLTREQAAKLIAYLDLGEKVAETLPATKVFNDVAADRWSAKYVAYCADAGYLAGVGDGNFDPTGSLTGYAFGKMLLCALGYDAAAEGFIGTGWAIAVAKLMSTTNLAKGVDTALSAILTREAAAQYCLNALKATCVEYTGGTNITIGDTTIKQGAKREVMIDATASAWSSAITAGANVTTTAGTGKTVQLGEKLYKGDLVAVGVAAADSMGRPAHGWTYKGLRSDDNTTGKVGTYADTAAYTVVIDGDTAGTYAANQDVVNLIKKETNATFLKNVVNTTTMASINGDTAAAINNYVAGKGDVLEVFVDADDADTISRVVIADYTYDSISNVNTNVSDTDKKNGITVRITTAGGKTITNKTPGFDAATFVKNAKIAVALKPVAGTVQDAYVLTKVSGAMSAYTGTWATFSTITVDGTKYTAQADASIATMPVSFKAADSYDLYLDANGYVLRAEATDIKTDLADVYYVAAQYVESTTVYGVEGFNIYAQTVALDGTVGKTLVATAAYVGTGTDTTSLPGGTGTNTYYPIDGNTIGTGVVNGTGTFTSTKKYYSIKGATDNLVGKVDKLVYFSDVTDESYKSVSLYNDSNVDTYNGTTELKTSTTKLANGNYVTAETKFVLVNGTMGDIKVKTYTGPVALPAGQQTSGASIYTKDANSNKIADYVFIKTTSNALTDDTTTRTVYYLADTTTAKTTLGKDGKTTVTSYTMYDVKGNAVEVAVDTTNVRNTADNGTVAIGNNTFYTVKSLSSTTGVATLQVLAELAESGFSTTDTTKQKTALYGVIYTGARYGDKISGEAKGVFSAADLNATNAVVIDLRTAATKANDVFGADITSLDLLQSAGLVAAANGQTVNMDVYATMADGATVIFVKSIGANAVGVVAKAIGTQAMSIVTNAAAKTTTITVTTALVAGSSSTIVDTLGFTPGDKVIAIDVAAVGGYQYAYVYRASEGVWYRDTVTSGNIEFYLSLGNGAAPVSRTIVFSNDPGTLTGGTAYFSSVKPVGAEWTITASM